MRGASGGWDDFDCESTHFRCLCELGSSASGAYQSDMPERIGARKRDALRYRVWLALAMGAFLSYPLLTNWQSSSSHRSLRQHVGTAAPPPESTTHTRRRRLLKRDLTSSATVLIFVMAFLPFILHQLGYWTSFRLGTYTSYLPLGPPSMAVALATIPAHSVLHCWFAALLACSFALIAVLLVKTRPSLEEPIYSIAFLGMAIVLLYGAGALVLQIYATQRRGSHNGEMCKSNFFYGRIVSFASGMLMLSFACCFQSDPLWLEHPFTPGLVGVAVSWTAVGVVGSRENVKKTQGVFLLDCAD